MSGDENDSYQEGYEEGQKWQSRASERNLADLLTGLDDPPYSGDPEHDKGVKEGIRDAQ